jgi:iron complex outermembrane receptor protein
VPHPDLTLAASYSFLDTGYTRLDPAIIGSSGTPIVNPLRLDHLFVNAPRHAIALSAEWARELGPRTGMLRLRGDLSHRSTVANDAVNTPELKSGPVTMLNGRASWEPDERWTLSLFVTNLLDEHYIISGGADPAGFGAAERNFAQPRRWGAAVQAAW